MSLQLTPIHVGNTKVDDQGFCDALRQRNPQEYQALVDRVADYYLVREAARREGLSASTDELQQEADNWRRAAGLLSARDTNDWLAYKNLSVDDLEQHAEFRLLARKLLENEYGKDALKQAFERNQSRYTIAALNVIMVDSQEQAEALARDLEHEPDSFQSVARRQSIDPRTASAGGMLGWIRLDEVPEAARTPVLKSEGGGAIVGPVESDGTWSIVQVAAIERPRWNETMERIVMTDLLSDWLAEERKRTQVEFRRTG